MIAAMAIQSGRKHGIDLGAILDEELRANKVSQENAAAAMGQSAVQLCRAMQGIQPLDAWKLWDLDWPVLLPFLLRGIAAKAESDAQRERATRFRMARAELRPRDDERKIG